MTNPAKKSVRVGPPVPNLVVELEYLAFGARKTLHDVMKANLADKDVKLDLPAFSRYCVSPALDQALPALLKALGKARLSAAKMLAEVEEGVKNSLLHSGRHPDPAFAKLVKAAQARGWRVGVISDLDPDTARQVLEKSGITDPPALLARTSGARNTTDGRAWRSLAKQLGVPAATCVAVVTSADASYAALAADMDCAAIPDAFTAFQDFGGVNLVAEKLDDHAITAILSLGIRQV
jgi:beta-phosphoglucomutase-like phosphatase (HAD superfamily)